MTDRLTQLHALRDALKAATGPDRDLDVELLTTFCGYRDVHGNGLIFERGNKLCRTLDGDENLLALPSPTASLDAAVTLVTADDWYWRVGHDGNGPDPSAFKAEFLPAMTGRRIEAVADTPALALCLARVVFEIAKAEGKDTA